MRRRTRKSERYVKLRYWLLDSIAWKSLPAAARALYLEIAKRYNGSNNGRIPYSVREAVKAVHISATTASRMLRILQDRGFIICTKKGAFSLKTEKDASEWLLTEYDSDAPAAHAVKEFMRWQGADFDTLNHGPSHHRKSRTRLPQRNRTVTPVKPHGYPSETVKAKIDPSTVTPVKHLQLPDGAASARRAGERARQGSAEAEEQSRSGADPDLPETTDEPEMVVVVVDGRGGSGGRGLNSGDKWKKPPGDGWQIAGDQPPRGAVVWLRTVKQWHTPQVIEITDELTPEQRREFETARVAAINGGGGA